MRRRVYPWALVVVAALAVVVCVPAALSYRDVTPKIVGNWKAGKPAFQSTCGVCHRLRAAGSVGTAGPNLDRVALTEAQIIKAITYGGASVMTKAQAAKYPTQGPAYRNALSTSQIRDIAAFVYVATHPGTVPGV